MNSKGKKQMTEKDRKVAMVDEDVDDELVEDEEAAFVVDSEACFTTDDDRKKKGGSSGSGGGGSGRRGSSREISPPICQAEKCGVDLSDAKRYHRRHKVCEIHAKAAVVMVAGLRQRFCQQCSRFHEVTEFDEVKRSCRRRLAGHNERRRKSTTTTECYGGGEGSHRRMAGGGSQLKESQWRQADERGRVQIVVPGNSTLKPFQMR